MDNATVAVLAFLLLLTMVSVAVSLNILLRGRIWQRLEPASRPRRWVLIWLLLSLFLTFVWLPVFVARPGTQLAKGLTVAWAIVFIGMGLVFKLPLLSSAVDMLSSERDGRCDDRCNIIIDLYHELYLVPALLVAFEPL